ncbi:G-type lectin S-receptor-like serine/threonine-protein kinase At4g03230 [Macadamia integrifolia]|uniref:G-type lectin S-receptor-like serine/threonine-protein kinase At4g03230 n=1 Tax=Macadamia integrifolia TaxID=60698 RepID=UPI001C4FBB56|nr:G-type lectin S-receptor-like serine/threonine-protein kinase At4g03230 [Macadamia integrifolia]
MDSGNLILIRENGDDVPIWQSFEEVSNTFLPGMGVLDSSKVLRSWKTEQDPNLGCFTFKLDQTQGTRYIINNGSVTYWRSQSSNDFDLTNSNGIPKCVSKLLSPQKAPNITNCNTYKCNTSQPSRYEFINNTRLVMHPSGQIRFYNWTDLVWSAPSNNTCNIYNACGPYGICNSSDTTNPPCKCSKWFKPKSQADWVSGLYSEGCTKPSLGCKQDHEFLPLNVTKVENTATSFEDAKKLDECRTECLNRCQCNAFSFELQLPKRIGISPCKLWINNDPKDLQEAISGESMVIYVRASSNMGPLELSHSFPKKKSSSPIVVIIATTTTGVIVFFGVGIVCIIIMRKKMVSKREAHRESTQETSTFAFVGDVEHASDLIYPNKFGKDEKAIDAPFFDFESIVTATKDFCNTNKLGQGGFGPVYKGNLPGGQEIAVKRLSKNSGQGLNEFKNEVLLIAKLQHRNLVRLLRYSIKGDEKILVYEYMPNKSLDSFIFDQSQCSLLNWEKRFNIIMGIARGLLYLHQDSRLKIIHRDLKTSNILLDEEMNPKISDFGLARIFGGNQNEENTNRVVGTYGYMSPEYALNGIFSTKSDVFSFGVMLLEIVSGKKNTGVPFEYSLNLLGYAWELWKNDKVLDFMDKSLCESYNACEVSKCVNVGLLCVQDEADDRPTMSNVVFMLGSETTTLPTPKESAFIARKYYPSDTASSSSRPEMYTINEQTITEVQGR